MVLWLTETSFSNKFWSDEKDVEIRNQGPIENEIVNQGEFVQTPEWSIVDGKFPFPRVIAIEYSQSE